MGAGGQPGHTTLAGWQVASGLGAWTWERATVRLLSVPGHSSGPGGDEVYPDRRNGLYRVVAVANHLGLAAGLAPEARTGVGHCFAVTGHSPAVAVGAVPMCSATCCASDLPRLRMAEVRDRRPRAAVAVTGQATEKSDHPAYWLPETLGRHRLWHGLLSLSPFDDFSLVVHTLVPVEPRSVISKTRLFFYTRLLSIATALGRDTPALRSVSVSYTTPLLNLY